MEKKILIDASQAKQTRVAITNNGNVDGYEFENINKKQLKGNIYLGKVSRVEPSLQAAFMKIKKVMKQQLIQILMMEISKILKKVQIVEII